MWPSLVLGIRVSADTIVDFSKTDKKKVNLLLKHQNCDGFMKVNESEIITELGIVIEPDITIWIESKNENIDKHIILDYLKSMNVFKIKEYFIGPNYNSLFD